MHIMKIIFLLLIYLYGNADCIYHTVQNSHNYFKNIRFGVFEDQRRTADIKKEELIVTSQLRKIQEWFAKTDSILKNMLRRFDSLSNVSNVHAKKVNVGQSFNLIHSERGLSDGFHIFKTVRSNIIATEKQIANFSDAALMQSASAIIWLQSTYDLNILQMMEGKLISNHDNNKSVKKATSEESLYFEDLFLISRAALEIELYALAIKFLVASVISHQKNKCTFITSDNKCRAYDFHSVETRYVGKHNFALLNNSNANFDSAHRFPFRITFDHITDSKKAGLLLSQDHGAQKRTSLVKDNVFNLLSDRERFRLVCRGVIKKIRWKKSVWFKSVLVHRQNPFLKLGPFKVQILSESPIKTIIHDIFSDKDTNWMYSLAMKNLKIDKYQVVQPEKSGNSTMSSQSNAVTLVADDKNYKPGGKAYRLMKIYDRITMATSLYTRPPFASEVLRVSSYGVSGSLVDHIDSWGFGEGIAPSKDSPAYYYYEKTGDRIGTFMGWLTDTDEGGATCFTDHFWEGSILPEKGAGLFWINNFRSHKRDNRLKHGGCPVLRGEKNIVNDWIFSLDQWKTWKCGIDIDSEFSVFEHFVSNSHKAGYEAVDEGASFRFTPTTSITNPLMNIPTL